ncbi:MAG TPA: tetratricopeptide repeat protein, partial [Deltaproteobacteria bacterium]|nr:tetratricopeptide repeat protein [Deltaproteobacteria bacterium]
MQDGSRIGKWILRIGKRNLAGLTSVTLIGLLWMAMPAPAAARQRATRALRSVGIETADGGWTLDLEFQFPIRYLRHTPLTPGRTLRIQVDPLDLGDDEMPQGPIRENLPIPRGEPIPLVEIVCDVSVPGEPFVEMQFERTFAFDVEQGKDFRHLVIRVTPPGQARPDDGPDREESRSARLLTRARHSIRDGQLDLGIALLTRVLELTADDPTNRNRMDARELLGLTHERKGELAHAQAEYEAYLADYPEGPASARVRQRLDALLTASAAPRKPLRAPKRTATPSGRSTIDRELFGSLAVRYFRSESLDDNSGGQFLSTNVLTDVDVAGRLEAEAWMVRGDLTGTFDVDVAGQGRSNDARISRLSIHAEDRLHGLEATLGRQRRSDSGVLGRFDGLRVAGDLGPHYTLSALVGMPVESTADTGPNTDTLVAGGAFNFEDVWLEGLQGQIFAVGRRTASMTDRAALGSEIRYSTERT